MKWMKHLTDNVKSFFSHEKKAITLKEELDTAFAPDGNVALNKFHVLKEDQRVFVCKMIAHGFSSSEISSEMKNAYGVKLTPQNLYNYKTAEKWKPLIKKFRDEFVASTDEVPGSHKRVRLERAERMYERAAIKGDIKFGLLSIEQQRKEFDKNEHNQFNILNQQYNYMSDDEVKARKDYLLAKFNKAKELQNGNGRIQSETGK